MSFSGDKPDNRFNDGKCDPVSSHFNSISYLVSEVSFYSLILSKWQLYDQGF